MTNRRNQRVVAVDTNILVWGVRRKGPPEKIEYAGYLFKELEQEGAQIVIPSIVVCEYINIVSPSDRGKVVAAINERFRIEPFDIKDVVTAAELWDFGKAGRKMQQPNARAVLRADALIIATAKNHGATEFYTEDNDLFTMANKIMTAKRLPTMPPTLFEMDAAS